MEPLHPPPRRRPVICSYEHEPSCWEPPVDVYRDAAGWTCKFDLAGVGPDDVEIHACGRCLTLSGVRRDRYSSERLRAYSLEICYSRFRRSVELPCDLERAEIGHEFRDGMLLVWIRLHEGGR
jgi:HSP20 family molecular chaperone IbpA